MKFKGRKEKIQFIKWVLNGKNKVTDLFENKLVHFIHDDQEPDKYFRSRSKNEYFTKDQLDDFKKKYPWKDILIIRIIHTNSANTD